MIISHYLKSVSILTTVLLTIALIVLNLYVPYDYHPTIKFLPLADSLVSRFSENKYVNAVTLFVIANIIAFFSYIINDRFIILTQRSYFPYFIAGTLIVAGPYMQTLCATHFSFLFVFFSLYAILSIKEGSDNRYNIINASLILSIGSFIQFQVLFFLPVLWIAASMQKSFNFRAFQASLLGVILPYMIVLGAFYVFGSVDTILIPIKETMQFKGWDMQSIPDGFWPMFLGVALFVVIGFFSFLRYRERLNTISRRSMEIFIVFMLANFLLFIIGILPLQASLVYGSLSAGIILSGLWIRISVRAKRLMYYTYLIMLLISFIVKF
ncbi:hypothetical protein ACE1ET_06500 [Saccharicrinis sp. FJH62]|uniref:hypothetical protein n=1 Tax=Saccharicrinis sp. FJH62 TaxID=3344657 RepID=UPI0035D45727